MSGTHADARRDELGIRLAQLRGRIAVACASAGRDPAGITLVAVTKTYPAADVARLVELGVPDIGENRDQDASVKAADLAAQGVPVRWHFVGHLQRNKCRSVVRYAEMVHSVDSVPLARALDRAAAAHRDRPLDVLVQVSLDADLERGGAVAVGPAGQVDPDVPPERRLDEVAQELVGAEALRLRGVMAVAPLSWDPDSAFDRLADIADQLRQRVPAATLISAGMTADLEQAIAHGATHVRIGSALLGKRAGMG